MRTTNAHLRTVDLDELELWLDLQTCPRAIASLLLQFERVVRAAARSGTEISYAGSAGAAGTVVTIAVRPSGGSGRRAEIGFCCEAGRFLKQYGPPEEERV